MTVRETESTRNVRRLAVWLIALVGAFGTRNAAQATFLPLPDLSAITNSILNPGGSGPVGDLLECTLSDLECFQLALGECPLFDEGCEQGRLDQLPLDLGHVVNGVHETVESLLAGEDCSDLGTVPEPGTMLLLATGILGLLAIRNKKGRQPAPVTSRSSSSRRT